MPKEIDNTDYTPFHGDGRKKVWFNPGSTLGSIGLPGTQPMEVTNAQARVTIKMFLETGRTTHSGAGATLWVVLGYCQHHSIAYQLTAYPGYGYQVQRIEEAAPLHFRPGR